MPFHSMILDDPRISARKIAETLEIFRERVRNIIHKTLGMRKLSVK
jgi:DNA-directed RNA polymerase sigma subunit (sigma70/sigma32)